VIEILRQYTKINDLANYTSERSRSQINLDQKESEP